MLLCYGLGMPIILGISIWYCLRVSIRIRVKFCSDLITQASGALGIIAVGVSPHFTVLDQSFNVLAVEG